MPSPRIERSPLHALRTPVSEQALEGFVLDVMDKVSRGIYPDPRGVSDPIQVTLNSRGALDDTFIPPASRHPFPFGAENRVVRVESENQIIAAGRFGADGVPVVELYTSNSPGSTPPAPPRAAERVAGRSGLFATGPGGRVQVFENGVLIGEQG